MIETDEMDGAEGTTKWGPLPHYAFKWKLRRTENGPSLIELEGGSFMQVVSSYSIQSMDSNKPGLTVYVIVNHNQEEKS